MKKPVLVAALGVLLLAGCATPEKDVAYESINDFAAAYEDGMGDGTECDRTENEIDDYGWIQTTCGGETILMMFTSDDKREEIRRKNPLESGERWVDGPNWAINDSQYEAEKAQAVLGGEMLD
ncbi:hypothetical protein LJ754_02385 [Arthrobacter sp. zg-Y40]|uniref:hypothetical protein n=1 Tax=Arthrobacter sp. zg-Y40 TaxID=2886939 RepID=UPI001D158AC1|nr:hypothetical protein [Arthrobacter sp. zg-Y40]MCC3278007.1 hypothetical protein [Arthrobacter sp. zg-Y40]